MERISERISMLGFYQVDEERTRQWDAWGEMWHARLPMREDLLWEFFGWKPQKHLWFWNKEECFRKIVGISQDWRSKLKNKAWNRNENTILPEYHLARVLLINLANFNFFSSSLHSSQDTEYQNITSGWLCLDCMLIFHLTVPGC